MNPQPEGRLGVSEAMRQVEMLLRRVADVDSPLLITGESGVGKEAAARFVHRVSTRANEPFVVVNCAAMLRNRIKRAVALSQAPRIGVDALFPAEAAEPDAARLAMLAEVHRAEGQHIRAVLRRLGPAGFGSSDPGSGAPLAPTPVTPDRPKHGSGGAAAHVEVTPEPPPDVIARRTVLPGNTPSFTDQRRRASRQLFQLHSDARCIDKD